MRWRITRRREGNGREGKGSVASRAGQLKLHLPT